MAGELGELYQVMTDPDKAGRDFRKSAENIKKYTDGIKNAVTEIDDIKQKNEELWAEAREGGETEKAECPEKKKEPEIEWMDINDSISNYCRQYAAEKTKRDIARNIYVVCGCLALMIVMLIINKTFIPGIFEMALLCIALVVGIYGYNMVVKYQKTVERLLGSGEAVYAFAIFEDFHMNEIQEKVMFIKNRDIETLCTLRFDGGATETFKGVIEKAAIGERVLIVKRKNLKNLASKDCLKMRYSSEIADVIMDTEGID
jgi:hypothetical protein